MLFLKPVKLHNKWKKLTITFRPAKEVKKHGYLVNRTPFVVINPANYPILDSHLFSRNYLKWSLLPLRMILKRDGIYPVDILFFEAGGLDIYYPFRRIAKFIIYRLNDLTSETPQPVRGRVASEREVLRKADLVLAVSEGLYNAAVRIRGTDKGVYLLPNGVHLEPFQGSYQEPEEYARIPRPRALFVGSLSGWFDWELLNDVAHLRPDISFVVVGQGDLPQGLPQNVHLLGPRSHERIPAYMQHADVGLILFKDLPRIRKVERPLKFYEYLASGLPIVSVSYGDLKKMAPFALFGNTPKEFAAALGEAIEQAKDPGERARRQKEAERYSWDRIFARFEEILRAEGVPI